MTPDEYREWVADYFRKFPSVGRWFREIPEDYADEQHRAWLRTFSVVEFAEAIAVSSAMADGSLARVGSFDNQIEETAIVVRRHVMRERAIRERPRNGPAIVVDRRPNHFPAGAIYRRVLELKDRGVSRDAIVERVMADIPPTSRRPLTFDCPACLDSGTLDVWSYSSLLLARDEPDRLEKPESRRIMAVACSCDRGSARTWQHDGEPPESWRGFTARTTYDSARFCLAPPDLSTREALDGFLEWAGKYWARRAVA